VEAGDVLEGSFRVFYFYDDPVTRNGFNVFRCQRARGALFKGFEDEPVAVVFFPDERDEEVSAPDRS